MTACGTYHCTVARVEPTVVERSALRIGREHDAGAKASKVILREGSRARTNTGLLPLSGDSCSLVLTGAHVVELAVVLRDVGLRGRGHRRGAELARDGLRPARRVLLVNVSLLARSRRHVCLQLLLRVLLHLTLSLNLFHPSKINL